MHKPITLAEYAKLADKIVSEIREMATDYAADPLDVDTWWALKNLRKQFKLICRACEVAHGCRPKIDVLP